SFLIAADVAEGRETLNFSSWEGLPAARRAELARDTAEEITLSDMPPWYYLALHPDARLGEADRAAIAAWAASADQEHEGGGD
ncbi:MAG TPA: heme-binding domain-containing protein, partial [Minicystis sp.]|nr:heme-binding domain-containing protein [Minicystis sp.]